MQVQHVEPINNECIEYSTLYPEFVKRTEFFGIKKLKQEGRGRSKIEIWCNISLNALDLSWDKKRDQTNPNENKTNVGKSWKIMFRLKRNKKEPDRVVFLFTIGKNNQILQCCIFVLLYL